MKKISHRLKNQLSFPETINLDMLLCFLYSPTTSKFLSIWENITPSTYNTVSKFQMTKIFCHYWKNLRFEKSAMETATASDTHDLKRCKFPIWNIMEVQEYNNKLNLVSTNFRLVKRILYCQSIRFIARSTIMEIQESTTIYIF